MEWSKPHLTSGGIDDPRPVPAEHPSCQECDGFAEFRVTSLDDPWPLAYSCGMHLALVCLRTGLRTQVSHRSVWQFTPSARRPE